MKKLIGSLITALLAMSAGAATAPIPTNIVTHINVQLTFTSSVTNITSVTTNIVEHISKSGTNFSTNIVTSTVFKSVNTPIASKDIIAAIDPTAPKGSYLALVRTVIGGVPTSYIAIRANNADVQDVSSIISFSSSTGVTFGSRKTTETATSTKIVYAAGSRGVDLATLSLNTATLSFSLNGIEEHLWTGDSISVGGFSFPVTDSVVTVGGTGSDSVGSNEIVSGTITLVGAQLGN